MSIMNTFQNQPTLAISTQRIIQFWFMFTRKSTLITSQRIDWKHFTHSLLMMYGELGYVIYVEEGLHVSRFVYIELYMRW